MEQVKSKTDKGQEEAPDQAAGEDSEGLWARVPHLQDTRAVGSGVGRLAAGWGGRQEVTSRGRQATVTGDMSRGAVGKRTQVRKPTLLGLPVLSCSWDLDKRFFILTRLPPRGFWYASSGMSASGKRPVDQGRW